MLDKVILLSGPFDLCYGSKDIKICDTNRFIPFQEFKEKLRKRLLGKIIQFQELYAKQI